MPEPQTDILIKRAVKGDMGAYRALIDQNQKLVVSLVYKMVPQKEDREDLCQEIFIKVYEKLGTFRFQSRLSTWIANIAFNHCANFLKKRKLHLLSDMYNEFDESAEDVPDFASHEKHPEQRMMNKELYAYLNKCMESLSLIQRTVTQLFHYNEFSLEEISAVTELPVNTVKSHLFRARAILKTEMLKYLNH